MNLPSSLVSLLTLAIALAVAESFSRPSLQDAAASLTALRLANKEDGEPKQGGFFQAIGNFWEELDAFMDDASARRLGNGAAFYGKRKSNFYGEKDKNKKSKRDVFDASEDYQGPSSSGYFSWMPDENGQWRPVSRMKNQILDKQSKS